MNCYCGNRATHVLVTYDHDIVLPLQVFCKTHAFEDDREECCCCGDYGIEVENPVNYKTEELLPTYLLGSLDEGNVCSEHP